METHVTFKSSKFPPCDGEEEQLNPGVWGKRLAEYLASALAEAGIGAEEPVPEDWGWYVPVRNDGFRLGVCCGHLAEEGDRYLCFTEPALPRFRRFLRKIDASEQLGRLVTTLDAILSSDPEITDIEWTEMDAPNAN